MSIIHFAQQPLRPDAFAASSPSSAAARPVGFSIPSAFYPPPPTIAPVDATRFRQTLVAAHPSLLFGARKQARTADGFQPILAVKVELNKLRYPVLISPKIDGNRGMVKDGVLLARGLGPIPNPRAQKILARPELEGFDGELIASSPTDPMAYKKATSFFRTGKQARNDHFEFWVFDLLNEPGKPFQERIKLLKERVDALPAELKAHVKLAPQITVSSEAEIRQHDDQWVAEGYEGTIIRNANAPYLNDRSTMTDQAFMKLKRFEDREAIIIGVRPMGAKSDEAAVPAEAGEIPVERLDQALDACQQALGGYRLRNLDDGVEFNLASGSLTHEQRRTMWKHRADLIGQIVKYKYMPHGTDPETGNLRHNNFLGFRAPHDLPADLQAIAKKLKPTKPADNDEAA